MRHVIEMMGPFQGCAVIGGNGCDSCGFSKKLTLQISNTATSYAFISLCQSCIRKAFAEAKKRASEG
jgi:hypothetical protein